jgi:hypothetical protein
MEKTGPYTMKDIILLAAAVLLVVLLQLNKARAQDAVKVTNSAGITVQNGALLFTNGNIILDNGSQLTNNGHITISKTTGGTANFTDNSGVLYHYGPGRFIFTGTGTQTIQSINHFGRIDIENTVSQNSIVNADKWFLKSGRVITNAFYAGANVSTPDAVEADAANTNFSASWFHGSLRRAVSPAAHNNYIFPVGDAIRSNRAELDNLTADPLTGVSYMTVLFGPKPGTDAGLNVIEQGTNYTGVNTGGIWYINPDVQPSGGHYDLKVYFNGFPGLIDNSFGILRRPDASSDAADWMLPSGSVLPASGAAGRTVADGFARRNHIAGFSQFGIGMTSRALPLQLLSFSAQRSGDNVLLKWTTANEMNTSHFELFKGRQSGSMNYLDRVNALGYGTTNHDYSYIDQHPYTGISFYKLKMLDIDGRFTWSPVVQVDFDEASFFRVYPNPVHNQELFIDLKGTIIKDIRVFAVDGRPINTAWSNVNNERVKLSLPSSLARGMYSIYITTEHGEKKAMIVVQ